MVNATTNQEAWTRDVRNAVEKLESGRPGRGVVDRVGWLLDFAPPVFVDARLEKVSAYGLTGRLVVLTESLVAVADFEDLSQVEASDKGFSVHVVPRSSLTAMRMLGPLGGTANRGSAFEPAWGDGEEWGWPYKGEVALEYPGLPKWIQPLTLPLANHGEFPGALAGLVADLKRTA